MSLKTIQEIEESKYFDFVGDDKLRYSLNKTYQYVLYLTGLKDYHENIREASESIVPQVEMIDFIERDIVIHAASIIEAVIFYSLETLYQSGSDSDKKIIKDIFLKEEKTSFLQPINCIEEIQKGEYFIGKKSTNFKDFKNPKDLFFFNTMIQCVSYKNLGIFNEKETEELHKVKELRNSIHLHSKNSFSIGTSTDIRFLFMGVTQRISSKLSEI